MEPRFFKRGNKNCNEPEIFQEPASMEPRFFKRGNKARDRSNRFSVMLQWNHVFSNVEIFCALRGSYADFPLQWNHVFSNVEMFKSESASGSGASGFNGTTFFQTWKSSASIKPPKVPLASMEPRFFKRGNKEEKNYE